MHTPPPSPAIPPLNPYPNPGHPLTPLTPLTTPNPTPHPSGALSVNSVPVTKTNIVAGKAVVHELVCGQARAW